MGPDQSFPLGMENKLPGSPIFFLFYPVSPAKGDQAWQADEAEAGCGQASHLAGSKFQGKADGHGPGQAQARLGSLAAGTYGALLGESLDLPGRAKMS